MKQRPAGITGLAAAALVILASKFDVELTTEESAVFVSLAVAVVSYFSPRNV